MISAWSAGTSSSVVPSQVIHSVDGRATDRSRRRFDDVPPGTGEVNAIYLAPALLGGPKLAIGDLGIRGMDAIRRLRIDAVEQLGDDLYLHAVPKES